MEKKYIYNPISYKWCDWIKYNKNYINDVDEWNELIDMLPENRGELTQRGNLSKHGFLTDQTFLVNSSMSSIEIGAIISGNMYFFVYLPRDKDEVKDKEIRNKGITSFKIIKDECADLLKPYAVKDNGTVELIKNDYKNENGGKIYKVELTSIGEFLKDQELDDVWHLDLHSGFPSGLVMTHPEFKPVFERYYWLKQNAATPEERQKYKDLMNTCIGAMWSSKLKGNRYPELARDAVKWNNDMLDLLTKEIRQQGLTVLGYNTDGIFIKGNERFTSALEGPNMGQFGIEKYDKFRMKSIGCYEYMQNGVYNVRCRGRHTYERIKPREKWQWGDIYKGNIIGYEFNKQTLKQEEINDEEREETENRAKTNKWLF